MTITEFLEARIAEDEAQASRLLRDLEGQVSEEYEGVTDEHGPMTPQRLLSAQMWAHYDGQSKRRSFARGQQIARLANPARVLAECAAKRAIIALYEGHRENRDARRRPRAREAEDVQAAQDRRTQEARTRVAEDALYALAAVYKDHPDYQQEWAL